MTSPWFREGEPQPSQVPGPVVATPHRTWTSRRPGELGRREDGRVQGTRSLKQSSDTVNWSRIWRSKWQRQKIITQVAETYLKSKAEVRNGQELVRDVGDIIKFTRSRMLGQVGCRHGEMTWRGGPSLLPRRVESDWHLDPLERFQSSRGPEHCIHDPQSVCCTRR